MHHDFLGLVAADPQGGVSAQHVEEDPGVSRELGRLQLGAEHQRHETAAAPYRGRIAPA